jgi:hypothetical protein
MSSRIEIADPLTVLRELPAGWIQTCVTHPPHTTAPEVTLAILEQVRRVLRNDGTLWLLGRHSRTLFDGLTAMGWSRQPTPQWAAPLTAGPVRLFLLSKQSRFFYDPRPALARPLRLERVGMRRRLLRERHCGRTRGDQHARLVKRCVLAGSSPIACGACGAPYQRMRPGARANASRRPTCGHSSPSGRCLVLDPFHRTSDRTVQLITDCGRGFLAIASNAVTGEY